MNVNIGLDAEARKASADALSKLLADSYTLYLKTHNFHWNVTGPNFASLHVLFETHYTELADAVDEIAERIRALGCPAPGSYKQFAALTCIKEETDVPSAEKMIAQLVADHEAVSRTAHKTLKTAQETDDEVTIGLATDRMTVHEKAAWMLRSML